MPFCGKCGKKFVDDLKLCPYCGTPNPLNKDEMEDGDNRKTVKRFSTLYGSIRLEHLPEGYIIDDRYEIKRKLGQGGFGAVYLAYDQDMNINKALKVIPEAVVNDKEAMYDLQKEAQTMISLNHPNIVRVYDFHRTGSIKYIDIEYIDGKTLTEIKLEYPNKQIPEDKVKEYALKIAEGLAYAHSKNVIHKDIKPQNVMITMDGEVKLMDFGIAETVRTSMSRIQNTSSSGTLVYMSPEQLLGKDVGKESDIYSFGAMLYELLSGHPPFYKGDINYQILHVNPEISEYISDRLSIMIKKCLEKGFTDRYNDFNEVIKIIVSDKPIIIHEDKTIHKEDTYVNEKSKKDNNEKKDVKRISVGDTIIYILLVPVGLFISLLGIFSITQQGPIVGSTILILVGGFIISIIIIDIIKKLQISKRNRDKVQTKLQNKRNGRKKSTKTFIFIIGVLITLVFVYIGFYGLLNGLLICIKTAILAFIGGILVFIASIISLFNDSAKR